MMHSGFEFELLDEETLLPVEELARACRVDVAWVESLVAHGIVAPSDAQRGLFPAAAMARLLRAQRLARDFELQAQGLALVLELLDEIERLRRL